MANHTRLLANQSLSAVSLGCMSLSHGYGEKSSDIHCKTFLHKALNLGYTMLDIAAVYGHGHNETMLGQFTNAQHSEFFGK